MKVKPFAVLCLMILSGTCALADHARIGAFVVDDDTGAPIKDVEVTASFLMKTKWHQINTGAEPNIVRLTTDVNGRCHASETTDAGHAGCYIRTPPEGYYRPLGGGGYDFIKKNVFGVWQPDNLFVTLRLQRVEHPVPLFVKKVGEYMYEESPEDLFSKTDGVLQFDLVKGDWLPPVGGGEFADMEFRRLPHEDFGEGEMFGRKGRSYRDSMSVWFPGEGNGLEEMKTRSDAGLKIRIAPGEGFIQEYLCWNGVEKDLSRNESYDKNRCFCFRIRTRRNDKGEIVEAYYGKIYGDIRMLCKGSPYVPVASVRFLYYLNPKNLDRNLEWSRQNLCAEPFYPRLKDKWPYKTFNEKMDP